MNKEQLAVACIEFCWALPIDDFIRKKALTVNETFNDARQKYQGTIRKFTTDIRHSRAWNFREAAKEVPLLQQVVDDFEEYDRKILSNKKVIDLINKNYDLLKNNSGNITLTETDIDVIDWYYDNGRDFYAYGLGKEFFKQIPGVDVKKICKRIRFIYKEENRINVIISVQEALNALNNNEDGDANLYKKFNRDFCVFDHKNNEWYCWKKHLWQWDIRKESLKAVDWVTTQYEGHQRLSKEFGKRIRLLKTRDRKKRIIEIATYGLNGLGITGDQWDQKPMLLACTNGVINLKNGTLLLGSPKQYLKTACPTVYYPKAPPPKEFIKFLDSIFDGDPELIAYIKRLFGYGLLGKVIERIVVIFYGEKGQNAKGTLLEVICEVLGPLASVVVPELLLKQHFSKNASSPSPEILALQGKRLIWASETNAGRAFDVGRVKWLVGGEKLTGRGMYAKNPVTFDPSHTLILVTNNLPEAPHEDQAFWHRVHVVPFNLSFVENPKEKYERKRIANMKEILMKEAPGILKWMVEGCLEYQKYGSLRKPSTVADETHDYREGEDQLDQFMKDCLDKKPNKKTRGEHMFKVYEAWAKKKRKRIMSQTEFGEKFKNRCENGRDSAGVYYKKAVKTQLSLAIG